MSARLPRRLDVRALYTRLDEVRAARDVSWRQVIREADITTPGLITRLASGDRLSADTLAALLAWLGETDLKPYIRSDRPTSEES